MFVCSKVTVFQMYDEAAVGTIPESARERGHDRAEQSTILKLNHKKNESPPPSISLPFHLTHRVCLTDKMDSPKAVMEERP